LAWAARFAALPAAHLEFYARRVWSRDRFERPRCTGVSSDALAAYALGLGPVPQRWSYPHDAADLAACELTYAMAPPDVAEVMVATLELFRAEVAAHLQDQAARDGGGLVAPAHW